MSSHELQLPETTRQQLIRFQQRVWKIKVAEGLLAGVFGLAVSWIAVFVLDRFVDTDPRLRGILLVVGSVGLAVGFPLKWRRWVWGTRQMEQVAGLVRHRYPSLGDQLLGVVELTRNRHTDLGSRELATAAIRHVDALVRERDFTTAVPRPRHRAWALAAGIPAVLILLALVMVPRAGWNAVARWLMPWRDVDRYTFAQIDRLPEQMVVPQGEPFEIRAVLHPGSEWTPESGRVIVNRASEIAAELQDNAYAFSIPAQNEVGKIDVRIGDIRDQVQVTPAARPELTALKATITLPEYLEYSHTVSADVRGGALTLVRGAQAEFVADISRELTEASVAGTAAPVRGAQIRIVPFTVEESAAISLDWRDELGLRPREPFQLKIASVDDQAPTVSFQPQEPQQVILTTDVVTFDVSADDDFGIRRLGLTWRAAGARDARRAAAELLRSGDGEASPEDFQMEEENSESGPQEDPLPGQPSAGSETLAADPLNSEAPDVEAGLRGEKVVIAGTPEGTQLRAVAAFCAETDGVRPQLLELRAWAEDYHPTRARVYSPVTVVHVMTPEEHAVWIADQLRRWASRADDVYEEEMRLHEANRELQQMDPQQFSQPDAQRMIEQQAAAESANAARLSSATAHGRQLIQQAMRNPDMVASHLETWAGILKQLEQIAGKRMPSVASQLSAAAAAAGAQAAGAAGQQLPDGNADPAPMAGNRRNDAAGKSAAEAAPQAASTVPQLVDVESGFNKPEDDAEDGNEKPGKQEEQQPGQGKFTLPSTILNGGPSQKAGPGDDGETQTKPQELDNAVEDQADLLLEFEKVRDELQRIMDDLENSTFVKRFKAASRRQLEVAADLNRTLAAGFGLDSGSLREQLQGRTEAIAALEEEQSRQISMIQTDLEAWLGRNQEEKFARILEEMKETDIILKLRDVGGRIRRNLSGDSISRAEYWADILDRWGEELVSVSKSGQSKSGSAASLPPAIVLEVMRILEGEIDLRDATRSLAQSQSAIPESDYNAQAQVQFETQTQLRDRTLQVSTDIAALPDGEAQFSKELGVLGAAADAMSDASTLLHRAMTGPEVIAAETEAIELLLQARRANPKSGGGSSGTTPGQGGDGTTDQAALALVGPGSDPDAVIDERGVQQSTGRTSGELPEEFRDGLDAFFQAVENTRN